MNPSEVFLLARLMGLSGHYGRDDTLHNGVHREHHPWDKIELTKAERKGKTPEEIQELRRSKWEAQDSTTPEGGKG